MQFSGVPTTQAGQSVIPELPHRNPAIPGEKIREAEGSAPGAPAIKRAEKLCIWRDRRTNDVAGFSGYYEGGISWAATRGGFQRRAGLESARRSRNGFGTSVSREDPCIAEFGATACCIPAEN